MVYKYGANHLHIGRSLIEILEFLEKRYNINFNELIKNDIEIRQLHMYKRKCLLKQGISINVENCTWEVGIDILDGKYEIYNSDKDYSFVHVYNTKGKRVKNISSKTHKATITIKNGYKLVFNKNHTIRMKVEI